MGLCLPCWVSVTMSENAEKINHGQINDDEGRPRNSKMTYSIARDDQVSVTRQLRSPNPPTHQKVLFLVYLAS